MIWTRATLVRLLITQLATARFGTLPGANVALRGAEQRQEIVIALGITPGVLEQLGQEADVREPLGVEVDDARAEPRLAEGDVARERGERIGDRIFLGRRAVGALPEARARIAGEAVEVEAEALRLIGPDRFHLGEVTAQRVEHAALALGITA